MTEKPQTASITIKMPRLLKQKFDASLRQRAHNMTALVQMWIEDYIDEEKPKTQ